MKYTFLTEGGSIMLNIRLKELRKECGITQKEFAGYFNLTESMISLYESGKRQPSYDVLKAISKRFNISIDYLVGMTDFKKPAGSLCEDSIKELISFAQKLSPCGIEILTDFAEFLSKKEENEPKKTGRQIVPPESK